MSKAQHTPIPLEYEEDASNGYESIVIEHAGCPILTVRGLDDMSCVDEEDHEKISQQIVATADLIVLSYNHHQELTTRLYNLVNVIEGLIPDETKVTGATEALIFMKNEARETLKKVIQ